nr:uncharacterized protein LOC110364612 isoform X2 [Columba livia]
MIARSSQTKSSSCNLHPDIGKRCFMRTSRLPPGLSPRKSLMPTGLQVFMVNQFAVSRRRGREELGLVRDDPVSPLAELFSALGTAGRLLARALACGEMPDAERAVPWMPQLHVPAARGASQVRITWWSLDCAQSSSPLRSRRSPVAMASDRARAPLQGMDHGERNTEDGWTTGNGTQRTLESTWAAPAPAVAHPLALLPPFPS